MLPFCDLEPLLCDHNVTSHSYTINQVDAVQLVNHKNYTATLHFDVGEAPRRRRRRRPA